MEEKRRSMSSSRFLGGKTTVDKEARGEEESKRYGVLTSERYPMDAKYRNIVAVPVEIEVSWQLDKLDLLNTLSINYSEWVERC